MVRHHLVSSCYRLLSLDFEQRSGSEASDDLLPYRHGSAFPYLDI
jgi:hypothetical protein